MGRSETIVVPRKQPAILRGVVLLRALLRLSVDHSKEQKHDDGEDQISRQTQVQLRQTLGPRHVTVRMFGCV